MTSPASSPSRHPWIKRILLGLAGLLVLLALALGIGWWWLHGEAGRRFLARKIEAGVNSQILGRISIGAITKLTNRGVVARDVVFTAPDSEQVIVVRDVDLEVRWSAALHGQFISPRARATGGRVVLHERGDALTIDKTFSSPPHPASSHPPPTGPQRSHVIFERIDVADITLVTAVGGVPDARISHIRGALSIDVREPGGLPLLVVTDLHGDATLDTPVAIHLTFTGGTFRFNSGSSERTRVDVSASLGGHHVRLHNVTTVRPDGPHIRVRLTVHGGEAVLDGLPTVLQGMAASILSAHFDFDVQSD